MVSEAVTSLVVSDTQRALDLEMVPFDLQATSAHVEMLGTVGIVSPDVSQKILAALTDIRATYERGEFSIDPALGAQLTLEKEVISRVGQDVGLAMHTGRSRNDQVMVTEMLYLRSKSSQIIEKLNQVVQALYGRAGAGINVPMPGYTHMQPGKPTALSHWYLAHGDCLMRGRVMLEQVLEQFNQCPLGSVESFGTTWPLDRLYVARRLGFARVWEVPQDAISNRGIFQLALLGALNQVAIGIGRMAADLMLYTTHEFQMVELGDEVAQRLHPITGSSVMAQKRNPDALELLRGSAAQFGGLYATVSSLLCGLPTGYNRDSREVKEYAATAFRKMNEMLLSLEQVVVTSTFDAKRMSEMVDDNYSLTTDLADQLAQTTGIPYRRMYKIVGVAVDELMRTRQPLPKLTAAMLKRSADALSIKLEVDDALISRLLDARHALERRAHIGGTAKRRVEAMLLRRRSL